MLGTPGLWQGSRTEVLLVLLLLRARDVSLALFAMQQNLNTSRLNMDAFATAFEAKPAEHDHSPYGKEETGSAASLMQASRQVNDANQPIG